MYIISIPKYILKVKKENKLHNKQCDNVLSYKQL